MSELRDGFGRKIDYVRIAVTDACNLNCRYCKPQKQACNMPDKERIVRLAGLFSGMGISKFKITGGEPLLRDDIGEILNGIRPYAQSLTLTTNGILLDKRDISAADSVNVSLDSLSRERYAALTGADVLGRVMRNIAACNKEVHINCVPIKGVNEDELADIASLADGSKRIVRFIELMPTHRDGELKGMTSAEVRRRIESELGALVPIDKRGNGPAHYFRAQKTGGVIGFIGAVTECFCEECNRIRVGADMRLRLCLHHKDSVDLAPILELDDESAKERLREIIANKPHDHSGFTDISGKGLWSIGG